MSQQSARGVYSVKIQEMNSALNICPTIDRTLRDLLHVIVIIIIVVVLVILALHLDVLDFDPTRPRHILRLNLCTEIGARKIGKERQTRTPLPL